MIGKLMGISGKNITFFDEVGRKITLKVAKENLPLLDRAIENTGMNFNVTTLEGEIVDLKVITSA